jgi:hypothetical protein
VGPTCQVRLPPPAGRLPPWLPLTSSPQRTSRCRPSLSSTGLRKCNDAPTSDPLPLPKPPLHRPPPLMVSHRRSSVPNRLSRALPSPLHQ